MIRQLQHRALYGDENKRAGAPGADAKLAAVAMAPGMRAFGTNLSNNANNGAANNATNAKVSGCSGTGEPEWNDAKVSLILSEEHSGMKELPLSEAPGNRRCKKECWASLSSVSSATHSCIKLLACISASSGCASN